MVKFNKSWFIVGIAALCLTLLGSVQAKREEQPPGTEKASSNSNGLRASDIRYYETPSGSPEEARTRGFIEHQEAIELVARQYLLDTGEKLATDFDNADYQRYVMSLGTAFDLFLEEDMDKIVAFVKFMDLYENYAKNEELAKYESKLLEGARLSPKETEAVHSLIPIDGNAPSTADHSKR